MTIKRLSSALLLALATAACDGGGSTEPTQAVARVFVTPAETSLNVGDTTRLSAQARDEANLVMAATTFSWTTLDPAVATVSTTGLVTAVGAGRARVVATAPSGPADTAVITVLAPAVACNTPGAAPELAVGGTLVLRGAEAAQICLSGSAAGAEYVIMPFHATRNQTATQPVRLSATGTRAVTGPPSPSTAPSFSMAGGTASPGRGDRGFHTRLNQEARSHLSTLVPGARAAQRARPGGPRLAMQQQAPTVGSLIQVNVATGVDASQNPCTPTDYRTGRIVAVGNRAVILADTANPAGGFTQQDYDHIAATFDTLVYPVNVEAFGEPFDMDQNGRVIIFYTRAVNELTPANSNFVVGGYFYGRDLFPKTAVPGFPACAGSNASELFYMLAPDPAGVVNGNPRSTSYVRNSTVGVVGHEFQHLISASRRLYIVPNVGGTAWSEDPWLNEGLSHIAEELLFYHRGQTGPRRNLGASILNQPTLASAFNEFQRANHERFGLYLKDPDQDSPYDRANGEDDDLATRGAAWGFLRWVADQRPGGNDLALWNALVNNNVTGLANLEEVLQTEAIDLFRHFAAANYTDDAVPGAPFMHPSWDYRSLYQRINGAYPLEVSPLLATPSNLTLVAGGTAYLRAGVNANQQASIQVSSAGQAPAASVVVTVVRTK
jgi:hypothetical protein